jgi:23S rRNA G2069 N7-methylase RlmK/C1962 C5-methylase RlmI
MTNIIRKINIEENLSRVLNSHFPKSLGKLWMTSINDSAVVPGFFYLVSKNYCDPIALSFIDKKLFPPIHIFPYDKDMFADTMVVQNIQKALDQRLSIQSFSNACRLVNGRYDKLPGLTIDKYDTCVVVSLYSVFWRQYITNVTQTIVQNSRTSLQCIKLVDKIVGERKQKKDYTSHHLWGNKNIQQCEITEVSMYCINKFNIGYHISY